MDWPASSRPSAGRSCAAVAGSKPSHASGGRGRDENSDARRVVAAPLLVEERRISGVADLPLPADLHVLVGVVGADADVPLLAGVEKEVVGHPAAARGGRAEELDLGVAAVVDAGRARL